MRCAVLVLLVVAMVPPRLAAADTLTEVHYVMGTYLRITASHPEKSQARAAMRQCFAAARRFDALFSRFDPNSELSRLNASAALRVAIGPDMAALLARALQLEAATDGTFDVSAGALTALWRNASRWPSQRRINAARQLAGAGALTLRGGLLLRRRGTLVELDGIAKGWAVDRCAALLHASGIRHALLSFGESSQYALGAPPGVPGWPVLLRGLDPRRALGTLRLRNQALSVSTVFGHAHEVGATRVGHIIDPRRGLPLTAPAMAVVVAPSATDAEAFSKALLIHAARGDRLSPLHPEGDAMLPQGERSITGALLVRPEGWQRMGRLPFLPFDGARPIAASAEPLR
ncbi:MAG: FAD:protein FMN transferase [Candidatus Binatia bacterium]